MSIDRVIQDTIQGCLSSHDTSASPMYLECTIVSGLRFGMRGLAGNTSREWSEFGEILLPQGMPSDERIETVRLRRFFDDIQSHEMLYEVESCFESHEGSIAPVPGQKHHFRNYQGALQYLTMMMAKQAHYFYHFVRERPVSIHLEHRIRHVNEAYAAHYSHRYREYTFILGAKTPKEEDTGRDMALVRQRILNGLEFYEPILTQQCQ